MYPNCVSSHLYYVLNCKREDCCIQNMYNYVCVFTIHVYMYGTA